MSPRPSTSPLDRLLSGLDQGLRTAFAAAPAVRPVPGATLADRPEMSAAETQLSGALMRVNHVGEVCAQALYQSQALLSHKPELREHFRHAAQEEREHLAWTRQRLEELGARTSLLNPVWYGGAFALGALAGLTGDANSLGFVVETERQVEQHLASHLDRLPAKDTASRLIVEQMRADEARHAAEALSAGGRELPALVKRAMRLAAGLMTRTAHYI